MVCLGVEGDIEKIKKETEAMLKLQYQEAVQVMETMYSVLSAPE
jgi:hypothetical protein